MSGKWNGRIPTDETERLVEAEVRRAKLDRDGQRAFVDLGKVMKEGLPPVEYLPGKLAHGAIYGSGVTMLSGHPDSGKSTFARRCALDYMLLDGHVLYFDWENGAVQTTRSFADMGASADLLSSNLHYIPWPDAPDWERIESYWERWPTAFGVWDSLRGVMNVMGLKENEASDCARFFNPLVRFALTHNVAMAVIDHVTKDTTEKAMYSRGSGDKAAAIQGSWFVRKTKPFSETQPGEIELTRWKARAGYLPLKHRFAVGDGKGGLTVERLVVGQSPQDALDLKIKTVLRDAGTLLSKRAVEEKVGGRARDVREALERLAIDEAEPVEMVRKKLKDGREGKFERYQYVPELDMFDGEWTVAKSTVVSAGE